MTAAHVRSRALSPAEIRALIDTARGYTAAQAGKRLGVAESTIKTQLKMARRALCARSTTHAVTLALAFGDITLDDIMEGQPR